MRLLLTLIAIGLLVAACGARTETSDTPPDVHGGDVMDNGTPVANASVVASDVDELDAELAGIESLDVDLGLEELDGLEEDLNFS